VLGDGAGDALAAGSSSGDAAARTPSGPHAHKDPAADANPTKAAIAIKIARRMIGSLDACWTGQP
jgi:hypothetical protein